MTANEMSERQDQHLESKLEKKRLKQSRKQNRRNKAKQTRTCETSSDCTHGHCCVEKKGHKYCKPSRKDEGQKCVEDCMCRSGLVCVSELIVPAKA
ncbi:hypothetical protein, partial [Salmonella sp. s51944]|uniref:hypothetical protein n=1 Tax=Salmonella sp. s51944 TaxID=3159655 RepID=UPI00397FBBF6